MKQETLVQKSAEGAKRIDAVRDANLAAQEKHARIREVEREISALKTPAMDYASKLVALSPNREWQSGSWCDKFYQSPLVKVGELEDGKAVYICAKQIFVSTSRDIDGYPTDASHEFNRWEYVAGVGEPTESKSVGSDAEKDRIGHLGVDMMGRNVRGLLLSEELLHPETTHYPSEEAARNALERTAGLMEGINETVELVRTGLANEEWNPREKLYPRNAQLVAEQLV